MKGRPMVDREYRKNIIYKEIVRQLGDKKRGRVNIGGISWGFNIPRYAINEAMKKLEEEGRLTYRSSGCKCEVELTI